MSDRPELLYKYRSLDGEAFERVRSSIITKQLWLSRPADFNDPFDCAPVVTATWDKRGIQKTTRRAADRRTRGADRKSRLLERKRLSRGLYRHDRPTVEAAQEVARETIDRVRDSMGVLSLAADPYSILMWSHYAGQHTGLLLAFRTDNGDLISEAQRVEYSTTRQTIDLVGDRDNTMRKMLLHKADYWRYEDEWRVVRVRQSGLHSFAPESLVGIVFGARMSDEHKARIRQAVGISGVAVHFGQARLDEHLFQLHIDQAV
ncbi:DUF2971 domain-containing protein [Sphingomonas sp. WKB10]|nr:DUF2971 domain-containing protein [Sphingomonas sp. WKB10]